MYYIDKAIDVVTFLITDNTNAPNRRYDRAKRDQKNQRTTTTQTKDDQGISKSQLDKLMTCKPEKVKKSTNTPDYLLKHHQGISKSQIFKTLSQESTKPVSVGVFVYFG